MKKFREWINEKVIGKRCGTCKYFYEGIDCYQCRIVTEREPWFVYLSAWEPKPRLVFCAVFFLIATAVIVPLAILSVYVGAVNFLIHRGWVCP